MNKFKTIALFGGTGFVGTQMREHLLSSGYSVRLLARRPDSVVESEGLTLIAGDLANSKAIEETLYGSDACIVVTGARSNSLEDMQTIVEGTRKIIETMQSQGIRRLLKLSGVSVRIGDEPFSLPRRLLDMGLGLAMKYPNRSKYLEQDLIEASNLDWTVIRPPVIRAGQFTRPARAHEYAFLGMTLNVNSLCQFFLAQLESDEWLGKSPTIG